MRVHTYTIKAGDLVQVNKFLTIMYGLTDKCWARVDEVVEINNRTYLGLRLPCGYIYMNISEITKVKEGGSTDVEA